MEEKKTVKLSLGTTICIFIIIILLFGLGVVYYFGFIKNNNKAINDKQKENEILASNTTKNTTGNVVNQNEIATNKTVQKNDSEFEIVYEALNNYLNSSELPLIKDDKIYKNYSEIIITGIDINKDKFFTQEINMDDENLIIGSFEYAVKLENIEGVSVIPTGDQNYVGNWIICGSLFIFNKTTNEIELASGL